MKKILALALTACLAVTMILPAAAADAGLDSRLKQVTLSVKQTLGIGDAYTNFTGQLAQGDPVDQWNLNWNNEDETINVTATEAGKIVSYYHSYNNDKYVPYSSGELTRFPKLGQAKAEQVAQDFLKKVLDSKTETADLQAGSSLLTRFSDGSYNFYGNLKLYGMGTPVYINVTVDSGTQAVTSFYRGDSGVDYASYPSAAKVSKDAASTTLFGTVKMQLNYAVSDKDENKAILRYVPQSTTHYAVDALTGKLVEVYSPVYRMFNEKAASTAADQGSGGLTDVELQAATDLKGVLSSADLEAAARKISELGITTNFTLNSVNYYSAKDGDSTVVYAGLSFVKKSGTPGSGSYSYSQQDVMLNAKTGEFISASAYGYSDKDLSIQYSRSQCEKIARAFAQKYNPEELAQTALSETQDSGDTRYQTFVFTRQVNNIAFPDNAVIVTVDGTDGAVGSYSVNWNQEMSFADPTGIKTEQEAKDIFTTATGIGLCYVNVSADQGESTEMKLAYDFVDQTVWGVDAAAGTPLRNTEEQTPELTYGDIAGHYAKTQIETLAGYGIGYIGGSFAPDQSLTQKDALTLIVAACGYSLDQSAEGYADNLYDTAYSIGLLTKADRQDDAAVTRIQLTKMLVDAAGFGEAAKLKDIYAIGFKDAGDISKDLYGYVAIAKGLGVVKGDAGGYFRPNNTATRAQLAIMIYNMMSR